MTEESHPELHEAPDFSEFVTDLAEGRVNQRLTETLAEVCEAVQETGLIGEVTVKFIIKKESNRALVAVEIKEKVPKLPEHATLFYFGNNGGILREDPKQLKFKGLEAPRLKTVKTDEDED